MIRRVDLVEIVTRATFLAERQKILSRRENDDDQNVRARLERLSLAVGGGDSASFQRWMDWESVDATTLKCLLQDTQEEELGVVPAWGETLADILDEASPPYARQPPRKSIPRSRMQPCTSVHGQLVLNPVEACLSEDSPIPFQDILVPALRVASTHFSLRVSHDSRSG
jgi:hypothetical protein